MHDTTASPPALARHLGLIAVTALVVGEVIAVGIFLTPASMARSLGSPFWLLVVWVVMGAMALSGALCYGELAARLPEAGGGYVYLRRAYGPAVAFLYGWKCLLVMDPGITAALAVGLASYVGYVVKLSAVGMKAVAVGAVLALAAVNIVGVRFGARLMQWLTVLKVGALLLMALLAVVLGRGSWSNFVPFVAQRANRKKIVVWGKTPDRGRVTIQRLVGSRWKTLAVLRPGANRVFFTAIRFRGRTSMRAVSRRGTVSMVWPASVNLLTT